MDFYDSVIYKILESVSINFENTDIFGETWQILLIARSNKKVTAT